jgi:hypothetical protein
MRIVGRALGAAALALAFSVSASAAGKEDLSKTPQAKVHQAMLKAVAAGDYEAYKKCMTRAAVEGIEKESKEGGLDPKKAMGILKEMTPKDLAYTNLKVDGKKATLEATGQVFGEPNKGTIDLEQENGEWKISRQSWTNKK